MDWTPKVGRGFKAYKSDIVDLTPVSQSHQMSTILLRDDPQVVLIVRIVERATLRRVVGGRGAVAVVTPHAAYLSASFRSIAPDIAVVEI